MQETYICPKCKTSFYRPPSAISIEEPFCSKPCFYATRYEAQQKRDPQIVDAYRRGQRKADIARAWSLTITRVTMILRRYNAD